MTINQTNKKTKSLGKNEDAWIKIFEKYDVINYLKNNNVFEISATQIKEFREPRLMTKFDHLESLPKIFRDNDFTILPNSRGGYLVGRFLAYEKIETTSSQPITKSPELAIPLETLDYNNLYSEGSALLCAFNTGIISDLLGVKKDECLFTVNGRMSTGEFGYSVNLEGGDRYAFSVKNSQCEVDAGFETLESFVIVEAKNYMVEDFLIRQLYYPYKLWSTKIKKKVVPVFMCYSNDIFTFYVYKFDDENNYNSLKLVNQKSYIISTDTVITVKEIKALTSETKTQKDLDKIPLPQADSFERVVDLMFLLFNADLSKDEITEKYGFDSRQTDYYFNALKYLGLACTKTSIDEYGKKFILISLTEPARNILLKNTKEKFILISKAILSHEVFNRSMKLYFENGGELNTKQIEQIIEDTEIKTSRGDLISKSTASRRTSTVKAWINWIIKLTHTYAEE